MDTPAIMQEFRYHYPQTLTAAPRAHAPAVRLLLVLLVTVVMGLVMLFVVPVRDASARTKAAQKANSAARVCGKCAQAMLDEMDKDGTLKEGRTVTYAAVAVSDSYIGTNPESASYGMIAYGKESPVSRSDVKDLGKLYEYTFEAVFTPANDKEN